MVTFLAAGRHLLLTTTKLYCFVTEARACMHACVRTTCRRLLPEVEQTGHDPAVLHYICMSRLFLPLLRHLVTAEFWLSRLQLICPHCFVSFTAWLQVDLVLLQMPLVRSLCSLFPHFSVKRLISIGSRCGIEGWTHIYINIKTSAYPWC